MILRRAKYYYKNEERLREQAWNKYRELSVEEKNAMQKYWRSRYHNVRRKKTRLKEYQKNYCEDKKCQFSTQQNSFWII